MNKRRIKLLITLCCIVAAIGAVFLFGEKAEYIDKVNDKEVQAAFKLLNNSLRRNTVIYTDFLSNEDLSIGTDNRTVEPVGGVIDDIYNGKEVIVDYKDMANYIVDVNESGLYYLVLDYKPGLDNLSDYLVDIKINKQQSFSEMRNISLPLYWEDETKDFPLDRYGDEIAPKQIRKEQWTSLYLYNNTYYTAEPLLFYLDEGTNNITITNVSNDGLHLGTLNVIAPNDNTPSYADYRNQQPGSLITDIIKINSIDYTRKNSTQAIYGSVNNPILTPHESGKKQINTLSWNEPGTEITYEVEIQQTGYYQIAFHYMNVKEEFDVFNTIKIDGVVPFKELMNYGFESTGNNWGNEVLQDIEGNPYELFLEKGTHTITIRSEQEPVVEAWRYARLISEHVTQFELDLTKITGTKKDSNRTWKMTKYMPEIPEYLAAYETLINHIRYSIQHYAPYGVNSAIFSDLDKTLAFIKKLAEYPDEIALYKEDLTGKENSILSNMGNFTVKIGSQNFELDMIYIYGNVKLPKAKASAAKALGNTFATLFHTFTSPKYNINNDPEAINIWVNRAITHVDLLQKIVDTEFTPRTGIKVKISIMPDVNKLTLAASAGKTPDIALGLPSHIPFELASREALYDLSQFEDFWEVADRFIPGAYVSYVYNEGVYAIPETLDFHGVIYRKDIFESIGLAPPDTWQDIIDMLPVLQRHGMNFYHNIAAGEGYKWLYQTGPLIFQNNGELYSEDGSRTAIDEPNAVKGIQVLGDLFISYSLDTQVNSFFNSFRYSILPIGITDLQNYILIKNGAPELEGQWALSNYPGTVQEDGSIDRWYIANGTGGIVFKDTNKAENAWEFLKWWTEKETQVNYAYTLQSTYGKQFIWLPSNIEAMKDIPIDQAEKEVILEQIKWLRDVPKTPGQYMLERAISDIWNKMVFEGVSAQVAIDEKVIVINREIRKKMKELGYYDDDGNQLKPYIIHDIDWIVEQIEEAKRR